MRVNCAPVRALTVYNAWAQFTHQLTDNEHYTCSVLHANASCKCCAVCTAFPQRRMHLTMLVHVVRTFSALQVHHVHQQCTAVRKNCAMFQEFCTFSSQQCRYGTLLGRVNSCNRHFSGTANVPCTMTTNALSGSGTHTDDNRHGFLHVWELMSCVRKRKNRIRLISSS